MRKPMVVGNLKMNLTLDETTQLCSGVLKEVNAAALEKVDVLVAPPFVSLDRAQQALKGSRVGLAAQNCHWETKGAYTGEVSPSMLHQFGVTHVILGHSERRHVMRETDEMINRKVKAVLAARMTPIVCVGEKLEERKAGKTLEVVEGHLRAAAAGIDLAVTILAYEPVWAIGTGVNATPEQAEEVHAALRGTISKIAGSSAGERVRILYGGSVSPENIAGLLEKPNVDGALVGGASLKADSFAKIVRSSVK